MRKIFFSFVLLALFLLPAAPAFAQGGPGGNGRVVIGQDFILKSGNSLNGDLVVIGGRVVIEQGATVNGDTVVIGGSLSMNGKATGNAVVIGGLVNMGSQSSVGGDLVTIGGTLSRAEGSQVVGNVVTNLPPPQVKIPVAPTAPQAAIPPALPQPGAPIDFGIAGKVAGILIEAILLGVLALTLTLFLHPQLDRVAITIVRQPVLDGALGLLGVVGLLLALLILTVLSFTLILIPITVPVAFILVVLLGLAWLFGMIALGMEVGDRLKKAMHTTWEPALSAGIGTFALVLVVGFVGLAPCLGTLASALVGLVGLGAAAITVFGTRPAPMGAPIVPPVAPAGTEAQLPPAA